MPAYETAGFEPPAPVARATVSSSSRNSASLAMLIDSGADVSVVPRAIADQLGATVRTSNIRLQMFDGTQTNAEVTDVTVRLDRYMFQGRFVVTDADFGILGRNILNLMVLRLDGPALEW